MPDSTTTVSEEDKAWLDAIQPPVLRQVAARHGKDLFQIVMQAGAASYALGQIYRQGRGNRAIMKAVSVLQKITDDLCRRALAGAGKSMIEFQECRGDVERAGQLAEGDQPVPASVSRSGIILDS